ncbi:MAG: DUF3520 domain-containing protein, partial [Holophagales bacterium]|nr:DUF3520 domain-containing protein [Holophagales bacterium]
VGLRARDVPETERPPALLTFVVDTSGSMAEGGRLELVKRALLRLLRELRPDDRVALVTYGSDARVVAWPTHDKERLRQAIEVLYPDGSTNAEAGLTVAYGLTAEAKRPGQIQRVILCSDGVANVGATSAEALLAKVATQAAQGVELTSVGVGMGNYNDVLLEQLADKGNGRYAYVNDFREAERIFVEGLGGTLQTLAAEARAQVQFDPEVVSRYRLIGYENRDLADHRFRDDSADAGEIGAGHTVTALYELKTHRPLRARDRVATVRLRWASVAEGRFTETALEVRGRDFASSFDNASRSLQLAALVAEIAEILKGSYWAREGDLRDVFVRLQRVATRYPGDTDVAELASLAGRAAELWSRKHGGAAHPER